MSILVKTEFEYSATYLPLEVNIQNHEDMINDMKNLHKS